MKRCLASVAAVLWVSVLAWGQGAVTLHWSWEVQPAASCVSNAGTILLCQVPEGTSTSVVLSISADPLRTVHVMPVAAPFGWPMGSSSSGWGTARTLYAFTPPPGSAGRRVEIVYRTWADGISPLELRLAVDVQATRAPCALQPSAPTDQLGTAARLPWSADRPITWDDFWAPPPLDRNSQAAAAIAMRIEYELMPTAVQEGREWRARAGSLAVTLAMERGRSWALLDRRTSPGLRHEQLHFDLAEAYRRLLEVSLRGVSAIGSTASEAGRNLIRLAESISQEILERHSAAQAQYDLDTKHGRDASRQEEWDRTIVGWLLSPYPRLP